MIVPLVSLPIAVTSGFLVLFSILLALSILLHKGRGGGMSDLFGGGMSTSMGGISTAERRLDRLTLWLIIMWVALIVALLVMYRYGI